MTYVVYSIKINAEMIKAILQRRLFLKAKLAIYSAAIAVYAMLAVCFITLTHYYDRRVPSTHLRYPLRASTVPMQFLILMEFSFSLKFMVCSSKC